MGNKSKRRPIRVLVHDLDSGETCTERRMIPKCGSKRKNRHRGGSAATIRRYVTSNGTVWQREPGELESDAQVSHDFSASRGLALERHLRQMRRRQDRNPSSKA